MNLKRILTLGAFALLASCATTDQVKELEEKVATLEEKVETLAKSGGKAAPKDEKAEKAAASLYEEIGKAVRSGDTDGAKTKLAEMKKKYSNSKLMTLLIQEVGQQHYYIQENTFFIVNTQSKELDMGGIRLRIKNIGIFLQLSLIHI